MTIITWIVMLAVLSAIVTANKEIETIQNKTKKLLELSSIFFLIDGAFFVVFSNNLDKISVDLLLKLCVFNIVLILLKKTFFEQIKILQKPECLLAKIWIANQQPRFIFGDGDKI